MKKLAIGLLLSMASVSAFANTPTFKTLADEKATFELCESFANKLNQNAPNLKPAIDVLRPYSLNTKADLDNLEYNGTFGLSAVIDIIGKPIDVIHIDTQKYAENTLIRHKFLVRRSNFPLYVDCGFYRPNNEWQLNHFKWSDQIYNIPESLF